MIFPAEICPNVVQNMRNILNSPHPDQFKVMAIWGNLTGYQSIYLGHLVASRIGTKVFAGPFRGMEMIREIMDRIFLPSLLGTYEWELHEAIESAIKKEYTHVINIGCAYGYYSVGFARRLPNATIYARDIIEAERDLCRKMAEANGVADRIEIGGIFNGEDFTQFEDKHTLAFVDIEGGEIDLLDPEKYPALKKIDMIVELHDCIIPEASSIIRQRFEKTHDIKIIPNGTFSFPLEKILGNDYRPDHFDNLIATWEGRGGVTPFGILTKKQ
ncbi:MAG: hypothetical protein EOM37_00040 [Proteobacteria bacterium]|nr:hypothetical protein [Alphaproteobacteria bacterium]NCC02428.1 hypothetical protein [Pseudomonadota bacterium]